MFFKHKSGNDGGGENKNHLEKERRRRLFLLLFLRLSFLLIISLREPKQLIINIPICKLM